MRPFTDRTATNLQTVRRRQATLTSAAMCVAIPGVCAFLVALYFFSD